MQIQVNQNLVSQLVLGAKQQAVGQKADGQTDAVDASLGKSFERILEKAKSPVDDKEAVEKTRNDLKNGTIESTEAILSVAETLLTTGI